MYNVSDNNGIVISAIIGIAAFLSLVVDFLVIWNRKKKGKCDGMLNHIGGGFVEAYLRDAMKQNRIECFGLCCEPAPQHNKNF